MVGGSGWYEEVCRLEKENAELRETVDKLRIQLRDESYLADELGASLKLLRERVGALKGMLQKCLAHLVANVQAMETRHPDLIPPDGLAEEILADEIRAVLSSQANAQAKLENQEEG